ncbi:metallophosphoesterase family protein [Clostridium cibarium]|uniref:Metallophosphoesterase n=1 Tax=Clostridium cibarium TaxID=2762247 RepID=A0ABR8PU46_9CLOT|nr:metallophosphoesterase [Clostridium cibarium]MBD7911684.1 metallophosphoesterase [Clostridium cibarium]
MIKKILTTLITIALVIIAFVAKIPKAGVKSKFDTLSDEVDIRFSVISDLHIAPHKVRERDRLKKVFSTIYNLDSNMKVIAIAGDLTDSGSKGEYEVVKNIINDNKKAKTQIIASMGNHEGNSAELFKSTIGRNPKENINLDGYHFITLSPRTSEGEYGGSNYYLDESWLIEQLDEAVNEDPNKPIFVFMHHGIKNTVCGTDLWNTNDLAEVFKKYPQVIHFSGHSHYPLNDPKSIYQKDFTAINTSTISYFELEPDMMYGSIPPYSDNAFQMMVVEVKGNVVKVKRLDLLSNQYIGEDWIIDISKGKKDFKYTDDRKEKSKEPYFDINDVRVSDIEGMNCRIETNQAKINKKSESEDIVYSYKYDFRNRKTGEIEKTYKVSSQFYLIPMPQVLSQEFEKLNSETEYEVIITAINAYGIESSNSVGGMFKTKKK